MRFLCCPSEGIPISCHGNNHQSIDLVKIIWPKNKTLQMLCFCQYLAYRFTSDTLICAAPLYRIVGNIDLNILFCYCHIQKDI